LIFIHDFVTLKLKTNLRSEMEISKVCLVGVISFLFISTAIGDSLTQNYGFNYDIKRLVPSGPSPVQFPPIEKPPTSNRRGGPRRTPLSKGHDPITTPNSPFKPSTIDKPTTKNYEFNYDINRLVPSGPSSIPLPPFEKLSTPIRRGGPRRTPLSKGKDPITTPDYPDPPPGH